MVSPMPDNGETSGWSSLSQARHSGGAYATATSTLLVFDVAPNGGGALQS